MKGTMFVLYMTEDADEEAIIDQLAELNAIPGCRLVPFVPTDFSDAVAR